MKPRSALNVQFSFWTPKGAAIFFVVLAFVVSLASVLPTVAFGDTAADIQQKIAEQNAKIAALEKEIAQYESQLITIGGQKKTLQSEVNQLDISRKKTGADISV